LLEFIDKNILIALQNVTLFGDEVEALVTKIFKIPRLRIFQSSFLFLTSPFFILLSDLSYAEQPSITADSTMGTSVSIDQANYTISEGTTRGGNQFHSFGRFNVFECECAPFTGPNSINNIIGRATAISFRRF
jgi:hypothetical protein